MSFISPSSSPPSPPSTNINMHIIGAGVPARVDAKAADEVGVLELDDLRRQTYHPAVDRGDPAVAVGVDGHVGGVAVLVLAVARRALHPAVMLGCAEAGVDVDVDVGNGFVAMPAGDLLDDELELVEQLRVHRRIAGPDALLVVIQEVAYPQMLGDRQVDVGGSYFQKPLGGRRPASDALG